MRLSKQQWTCVVFFLALTFLWGCPYVFAGYVSIPSDRLLQENPWRFPFLGKKLGAAPSHRTTANDVVVQTFPKDYLLNAELRQGRIPLWDPYVFCGAPNIGIPNSPLYPVRILAHLLGQPLSAHQNLVLLHFFLTALFASWLLLERNVSLEGALLGGTSASWGGLCMAWAEFESVSAAMAWGLFCCYQLERLEKNQRFAVFWLALGTALTVLPGHAQFSLYAVFFVSLYAVFRLRSWRNRGLFLVSCLCGVLLTAISWYPLLTMAGHGNRNILSVSEVIAQSSLSWEHLLVLVNPESLGNSTEKFYLSSVRSLVANSEELWIYVGWAPLVLAGWGVRKGRVFALASLLALLYVTGPLFHLATWLPPPLASLVPGRAVVVLSLGLALMAGHGLDEWREGRTSQKASWIAGAFGLCAVFGLLWSAGIPNTWLGRTRSDPSWIDDRNFLPPPILDQQWPSIFEQYYSLSNPTWWASVIIIASFMVIAFYQKSKWVGRALLVLTAVDLLFFSYRLHSWESAGTVYPPAPAMQFLQESRGVYRVGPVINAAQANTFEPYGIEDFRGYQPIFPERVARFWSPLGLDASHIIWIPNWTPYCFRAMDMVSAKYIVTNPMKRQFDDRVYGPPVYDNDMIVYENSRALPRAYVVGNVQVVGSGQEAITVLSSEDFDHHRQAVVESLTELPQSSLQSFQAVDYTRKNSGRVEVRANLSTAGLLVVTDTYDEGWSCFVDGAPKPILPTNVAFRGVWLEKGDHAVVFVYQPKWLSWGLKSLVFGLLILPFLIPLQRFAQEPIDPAEQ